MKVVILDATKGSNDTANIVGSVFEGGDHSLDTYKIENCNIKPCSSCGACGHATPGKCVIKDDMQAILRSMAQAGIFIFLTPVAFGGYASLLKKAVDRLMPFGLPLYIMKGGHLLHPMRYRKKFFLAIGLMEKPDSEQERNFRELAAHNALNFQYAHKTVILVGKPDVNSIRDEIKKACAEVASNG